MELKEAQKKVDDWIKTYGVSQIKYKHSNVNISRKVLKRPKLKQKTSFNGHERKYNKCQYK